MDGLFVGKNGFVWWKGVVEDRKDPIFLGRVRVRIFGWHTDDKTELPTQDLPWAMPSLPIDNGRNPVGLKEGDWVWGFFLDGNDAQKPIVVGYIPGIDEEMSNPNMGFNDPTTDDILQLKQIPRPPEMIPVDKKSNNSNDNQNKGKFGNTEKLPGQNTAFGELISTYNKSNYRLDLNKDGIFDAKDVQKIIDSNQGKFFSGKVLKQDTIPVSRYPLEDRLMEPSTSRLSRNEHVESTIVENKKSDLSSGQQAGYQKTGLGDSEIQSKGFSEPESPYDATYPFNHVYESESGHVIEVDDTPGAERLHWYHRSGSFREIHPDGTLVNKTKNSEYNFIEKNYYNASLGDITFDAESDFFIRSGESIVLNSTSNMNQQIGGSLNSNVGGNSNLKINGKLKTVIGDGASFYIKDGILHVKVKNNIVIESDDGGVFINASKIDLNASEHILLNSEKIFLDQGKITDPGEHEPHNDIIEEDIIDAPTDASPKYGFLFPNGNVGDVWKPISDSDKKLVIVTESGGGLPVDLFEAIPTDQLETVKIVYQHIDNTFTEWEIIRPIHKLGNIIETSGSGRPIEPFEGGPRWLHRFSKSGKEYPKQLFWKAKNAPISEARLILNSSERHQSGTVHPYAGRFDDKILVKK